MKEPRIDRRAPDATSEKGGGSKEKKQLVVLGVLAVVLAVILVSQTGGEEQVTPAAPASSPVALATTAAVEPTATAAAEETPAVEANPALTGPAVAPDAEDEGGDSSLLRNPFVDVFKAIEPLEEAEEDIPVPSVRIDATLVSERDAVAVVDGRLRYRGDLIQGWTLESIASRQVVLRSPTSRRVTVSMPLLKVPAPRTAR